MKRALVLVVLAAAATAACGSASSGPSPDPVAATSSDLESRGFRRPGNILISDQFNNRVIEIDPAGHIVWHFGLGPNDVSANSIIGVNDAQRVGSFTLMAGTGAPPGTEP